MIHPLQLRHDPALDVASEAWFLSGDSVARWLEELARCGLATMDTRLFLVPQSVEERSLAGLLVVPGRSVSLSESPAGLALRLIGGRLFVPVDAVLRPTVTDAELRILCRLPISFFHPVLGLSGFEDESVLRVSNLIELPEERVANWNFARPGASMLLPLTAVVLLQPPSIDDIFGGAEEDIGSEPILDLPPAPNEPKDNLLDKTIRELGRLTASGVAGMMRHVPHTGVRRTWVNDLEDWAKRHLREASGQLDQLRHKELHRLLHLFDTDPEAGLRHAIPMNDFAHRGVAPPGGRLGTHSLDFDPRKLGGGPADFWNVPQNLREVLRRRYREMADREMQLGRHRRAAYIYAELLGDLVSAANALKQGRLFREAALLYEDHLRNPLEAARCLAEGGLLAEAIERYTKLNRWLEVADLHERAGDQAAANEALRRVVNERLAANDVLGAAKLVGERLHSPDEALEMLLRAWPGSHQATNCIGAAFKLLARLGRHEIALERIAQFTRELVPDALALPLVSTLSLTARDYPQENVRHRAADFSRVLIARQLQRPGLGNDEAGRLLEHLVRLAPQDRLLSRDANRYLAERRSADLRARQMTPPPVLERKLTVHHRLELPRQIQWFQLRRESNWFYALGYTNKHLTLLRGVWEGEYQSVSWDAFGPHMLTEFFFEPTGEQGKAVALIAPNGAPLAPRRFPKADRFFDRECVAGTLSWMPRQDLPFAMGEDSVWTIHLAAERAVLSCYDKTRALLQRTVDITNELLDESLRTAETRLSAAAQGNTVAVAYGTRLVLTRGDGELTQVELPGQAVKVIATLPNTRQGFAVMLNHGAVMHWTGADSCIELDRDISAPKGAFIPGGPLVLISGLQLLLLEVDSRGVQNVTRQQLTGQPPVGVSATANPGEFALLTSRGEMTVYGVPRREF